MKELMLKHDRVIPARDERVLKLYQAAIMSYGSLTDLEAMLEEFSYTDAEKASFDMNKVDTRKWRTRLARSIQMLKGAVVAGEHFEELLKSFVDEGKKEE